MFHTGCSSHLSCLAVAAGSLEQCSYLVHEPPPLFSTLLNYVAFGLEQAKRLLGWTPKHTITDDLAEYFEGYKTAGKVEAEPGFDKVRVSCTSNN